MAGTQDIILVAGGAGYIGSHAVKALSRAGYRTLVYDNLVTGHRDAVLSGDFVLGDLNDRAKLDQVFGLHRIRAVMHFAASCQVGESVTNPLKYWHNNVAATVALLETMQAHDCRSFIFSSTAATFGEPERTPIDETHPQRPINPYGATKLVVEQMLADCERAWGLKSVIFRYFNAAGCDPEGELGERHDPETHLIPLVLRAMETGDPVGVFGNDWPTPDGTCVRDYVHVTDLAQAHLLGLERLLSGGDSAAYNLGNGRGMSVRQVIDAVERVTGRPVPHRVTPRRPGDPAILVATSEKASKELGWKPQHASLDQIVETAWRYRQGLRAQAGE